MADRIVHPNMDKVVWIPDFVKIGKQCIEKLLDNFLKYGNTWVGKNSPEFWEKRLNGEIDEILKAGNAEELQKECIDAINILAMIYEGAYDIMEIKLTRQEQTTTDIGG